MRKILAAAELRPEDTVLEIGPGRGILTRALCAVARSVIAVEVDLGLAAGLDASLADCRNLDLRRGDALKFPYETLPPKTVIVANLPYSLSTPLLFKLLAAKDRIDRMVLMLQTEVARRLAAKPGSGEYGVLSVLVPYAATVSLAFQVTRQCFRPQPKVDSTVVRLGMHGRPPVHVDDQARFVRTVRAAFAHRRKTLTNSLRDEGLLVDRIARALAQAGIAPSRRAETLSLGEFAALANALGDADSGPVASAGGPSIMAGG